MLKIKKKILIPGILVALLALALGCLAYAALWGGNYLVFEVNSSTYIVDKIRAAEKQGGPLELADADVNALMKLYTKKGLGNESLIIEGAYVRMANDQLALYLPVNFKGWDFLLYTQGTVLYAEEDITFVPTILQVGKIKLPKSYVLEKLSPYLSTGSTVTVSAEGIAINKKAIPYNVTSLIISDDKLVATLPKPVAQTGTSATQTKPSVAKSEAPVGERKALLQRTSTQLTVVYADVESQETKLIITEIQAVVNKMIQDPNYQYQTEADLVKSEYNQLAPEQKSDIKDAILMDMEIDTLREVKDVFGL